MLTIEVKKTDPRAVLPAFASDAAAGADLCALLEDTLTIRPGETVFVHTGLSMAIPAGYAGFVFARSGLSCKRDLAPANKVGIIDADYRGEIMVAMHNHGGEARTVAPGERIAQIVILPVPPCRFEETDALPDTARGEGGFGSTGK